MPAWGRAPQHCWQQQQQEQVQPAPQQHHAMGTQCVPTDLGLSADAAGGPTVAAAAQAAAAAGTGSALEQQQSGTPKAAHKQSAVSSSNLCQTIASVRNGRLAMHVLLLLDGCREGPQPRPHGHRHCQ